MCGHDLLFDLVCLQKKSAKKRFRKQIFEAWGSCAYCDRSNPTTLDHVVPKASGGSTTRQNLIAACADCNLQKGSQLWFSWYRSQKFWTQEREDRILDWVNQSDTDPLALVPVYTNSAAVAA